MGYYFKRKKLISYDNEENIEIGKNPVLRDYTYNPEVVFFKDNFDIKIPKKYKQILYDLETVPEEIQKDMKRKIEYVAKKNNITVNEVAGNIEKIKEYMMQLSMVKKCKDEKYILM